jgi:hypothetical protein
MREDDASYCRRRAVQEQVAAQSATCDAARFRHQELSEMYRFRAVMLSEGPESWFDEVKQEPAMATV